MTAPQAHARNPLADLPGVVSRLPRYVGLARSLLGDPTLSRRRKAAIAGGLAYLAMPLDLVPGIIPVAGQLDDLAALLLSLRFALRGCAPAAREAHLRSAGLTATDLDHDLAVIRSAAGWIDDRALDTALRLGAASAKGALGLAALATRRVAGRIVRRRPPRSPGQPSRGR